MCGVHDVSPLGVTTEYVWDYLAESVRKDAFVDVLDSVVHILLRGRDSAEITAAHKVDMMVMGTRRKNIFSRLFNPSWAHRLLFHTDMPIMSIPVQS